MLLGYFRSAEAAFASLFTRTITMSVEDVGYMAHTSIYLALLLVTQDADLLGTQTFISNSLVLIFIPL